MQGQKGVCLQVGIQERRALFVLLVNRWSTAGFVPPPVYIGIPLFVLAQGCTIGFLNRISLVRASGETFRRRVFDALESARKDCSLGEQF